MRASIQNGQNHGVDHGRCIHGECTGVRNSRKKGSTSEAHNYPTNSLTEIHINLAVFAGEALLSTSCPSKIYSHETVCKKARDTEMKPATKRATKCTACSYTNSFGADVTAPLVSYQMAYHAKEGKKTHSNIYG